MTSQPPATTLTGIAADLRAKDHGLAGLGRRLLAVLTMLAGGAVGALLVLHASTAAALGLAAGPVTGSGMARTMAVCAVSRCS